MCIVWMDDNATPMKNGTTELFVTPSVVTHYYISSAYVKMKRKSNRMKCMKQSGLPKRKCYFLQLFRNFCLPFLSFSR